MEHNVFNEVSVMTEPTPQELKNEIMTGPLAITLAGFVSAGKTEAISRAFNVADRPGTRLLSAQEVINFCIEKRILGRLLAAKEAGGEQAIAASVALWALTKATNLIDLTSPEVGTIIKDLIGFGLLAATEKSGLEFLALATISRAEELGWSVSRASVAKALKGG